VIQNLVNTGKAKLMWRDFPYYGPDSVTASEAAYAAGDQGKFWQFHDLLFQNQQTPNNGWASRQNMDKFAQQLGLDIAQFDQDLTSGKYESTVSANHALAIQAGVSDTPTFFLIGPNSDMITISGGQPEPVFEQAVTQLASSAVPEYPTLAVLPVGLLFTLGFLAAQGKRRN
jgi:protein-disulfide isomerase